MSADPFSSAAVSAAAEARHLRPWVYAIFVLAVVLIVTEIGVAGLKDTAHLRVARGVEFDWWQAADELLRHVLRVAPAFALASALWYAQDYLQRLEKGELWAPSTALLVTEIGGAMVTAAALEIVIVPSITGWLDRESPFAFNLEPTPVVLGGLGLALTVIGRGLRDVVGAAGALKSEHDQIV
jgi:hypothetical protein